MPTITPQMWLFLIHFVYIIVNNKAMPHLFMLFSGTKTPKSQKKVATMDKVLKNIMIERKNAALQKEARKLAKSPRTPQSIHRPKMGTPPISSNFGQGQKLTPLRPPTVSEAPPVRNLSALSDVESQSNVKSDAKNVRTPGNSHTEDLASVKTKTEDKDT